MVRSPAKAEMRQTIRQLHRGRRSRLDHHGLPVCTASGLSAAFLREALLEAALLTGFEVKAVFLDVLADALTLHLTAEAAEGLFERLVFTDGDDDQMRLQSVGGGRLYGRAPKRKESFAWRR